MSRNIAEITRTLLMITVMVASALMPMAPGATELKDERGVMHASISVGTPVLGDWEGTPYWYNIVLDEAPGEQATLPEGLRPIGVPDGLGLLADVEGREVL